MTTSLYQVTENPIVYYVVSNPSLTIQNGSHPRGMVMREWGAQRHVPPICGSSVQTRNGEVCKAIPTWFQNGRWSCGHHRLDKTMNRSGFKRPAPPPPPPPPFEPFECSICISKCRNVKNKYITPCNHSFHRRCMKAWYNRNNGRSILECPLCRAKITKHPFKKPTSLKPTIEHIQRALASNQYFRTTREELIGLEAVIRNLGLPPRELTRVARADILALYNPTIDPDELAEEWTNRIMSGLVDLGAKLGELLRAPIA